MTLAVETLIDPKIDGMKNDLKSVVSLRWQSVILMEVFVLICKTIC